MLDAVLGKVAALKRAAEPEQSRGISGCYDAVRIRNGVKLGFAAGQQGGIRKNKTAVGGICNIVSAGIGVVFKEINIRILGEMRNERVGGNH